MRRTPPSVDHFLDVSPPDVRGGGSVSPPATSPPATSPPAAPIRTARDPETGDGPEAAASADERGPVVVERNGTGVVGPELDGQVDVTPVTVERRQPQERPEPLERQGVEVPAGEPTVASRLREALGTPAVRDLLRALLFAVVALWAVLFVPLDLALVLGAFALLPVSIVAVPWLVSLVATALLDR